MGKTLRLSSAALSEDARLAAERAEQRATTPDRLHRVLRGDLETIVAKALKSNPAERYASVAEFAEDLRRVLEHQPIAARPDSLRYRATKFAQRHWRPLAAGDGGAGGARRRRRLLHAAPADRARSRALRSRQGVAGERAAHRPADGRRSVSHAGCDRADRPEPARSRRRPSVAPSSAIGRSCRPRCSRSSAAPSSAWDARTRRCRCSSRRSPPDAAPSGPPTPAWRRASTTSACCTARWASRRRRSPCCARPWPCAARCSVRGTPTSPSRSSNCRARWPIRDAASRPSRCPARRSTSARRSSATITARRRPARATWGGSCSGAATSPVPRVLLRENLATALHVLGPDHPNTGASMGNLANLLIAKGDPVSAEPLARAGRGGRPPCLRRAARRIRRFLNTLGLTVELQGRLPEAERHVQRLRADRPRPALRRPSEDRCLPGEPRARADRARRRGRHRDLAPRGAPHPHGPPAGRRLAHRTGAEPARGGARRARPRSTKPKG